MQQPGDHIDIWVVERALGSGGMGSVYRCHNRTASRILAAVKVLDTGLRRHPESEARFIREAEILFHLDHPNIVKVRNVRTDTDPPYLEMEFVEGESLEDHLQRGPLPPAKGIELMRQCASALCYLHEKGVCHRDIKPANLLIQPDGVVKLVDFGLAVEMDATRITQQGMAFGTVSYAPPEWIAPDQLDARLWDVYALGVVFFETLTGDLAFPVSGQGSARQQAMQVIVGKQGHPPLDPGPRFHDDVRALIGDMTQADPRARLAGMQEVAHRVRMLPELSGTVSDLPPGQSRRPPSTWPMITQDRSTAEVEASQTVEPPRRSAIPAATNSFRVGRRTGLLALGVLLLAFTGGLAFTGVGAAALVSYVQRDSSRDVEIKAQGSEQADVHLGDLVANERQGSTFHFVQAPIGRTLEARWATGGEGCDVPACFGGGCPTWCAHDTVPIEILPGSGVLHRTIPVPSPSPHDVTLTLPNLDELDPSSLVGTLGDRAGGIAEGAIHFEGVLPGRHPLELRVGDCPPETAGCWQRSDCPGSCSALGGALDVSWEGDVRPVEPWAGSTQPLSLELPTPRKPPPAPTSKPAPTASPAPKPSPAPAAPRPDTTQRITVRQFARWLEENPSWQRDGENGQHQGSGYLMDWSGTTPPEDTETQLPHQAIHNVSFYAARRYCRTVYGTDLPLYDEANPPSNQDDALEWQRMSTTSDRAGLQSPSSNLANVHPSLPGTFRCQK